MKNRIIAIMLCALMIVTALPIAVSAAGAPVYEFDLSTADSVKKLVNTHLLASFDATEGAIAFANNNTQKSDQGFTPTTADDETGTANTDLRKAAANALKGARYVVITYKNQTENKYGQIRGGESPFYKMGTEMTAYEDVIVPTPDGAAFRTGGGRYEAPFCLYPFSYMQDGAKLSMSVSNKLFIKKIAAYSTLDDAKAACEANVTAGVTAAYAYADQDKLANELENDTSISDLLTDLINNQGKGESGTTIPTGDPEKSIVYDGSMDMIEWNFSSKDLVTKHTTNTNNFYASYDELTRSMKFAPKKDGAAGDQGIVAASDKSEEAIAVREQFVKNMAANYKYMVLTYKNESNVNKMIHRYVGSNGEVRAEIALKSREECADAWQRVVINATDGMILRAGTGTNTSNLCFFPLSGEVTVDDVIYWKSLAFFKTKEAAEKYAAEEVVTAPAMSGADRTDKPFISGYSDFTFKPDANMTRAEVAVVITRLLTDEASIKGKYTSSFSDVEAGAWYYDSIAYLESLGYLASYSGSFAPTQPITRAEFVEFVCRMKALTATEEGISFTDVDASHPRYAYIAAAASNALVGGYPDGSFKPDGTITRAEAVKVLCTALDRTPTLDGISTVGAAGFKDISREHWAYPYVIEAAFEHELVVDEAGAEIWISVKDDKFYLEKASDEFIASLDTAFDARVASILSTESEWTLGESGRVVYISMSDGDDTGLGRSADKPIKTIERLNYMAKNNALKAGDVVLFKRGDEWHEKLTCVAGVTYSAYGEGAKPRILGSIEADDASMWLATDKPNLYKLNAEVGYDRDVGTIIFNEGEAYGMRVLKQEGENLTVAIGDNGLVSNGLETWDFPVQAFTDQNDLNHHLAYYHNHDEKAVYLYCEGGNPGDVFDSIEVSTKGNVVSAKSNCVIDNLCIKYGSSHGVGAGSCENLTVRNCEIGWIGGGIQNLEGLVRFGNAIEIYGEADGYYVYNNYVYQAFDCGPTVQRQGDLALGQTVIERDIKIYGNAIEKCNSPLEVWLTTNTELSANRFALLQNCYLYDNLCRKSGYGFGGYIHQKSDYNMFYGGGATNAVYENCFIENNTMWDVRKYLQKATPTHVVNGKGFNWRNNTIIMAYEGPLALLGNDYRNAKGGMAKYTYDNETIKKLIAGGAYGFNRFMYTLKPGQADPAN